jgi:large subunit ribosomal protein L11
MAKKVSGTIKLQEFCRAFNTLTEQKKGIIIPVIITVYEDKSFTFITKTPPAATLIKKALMLEKGSGEPNKNKVGSLTPEQLEEIAKIKQPDLNANDLEAAKKIIGGTARSMGVEIGS